MKPIIKNSSATVATMIIIVFTILSLTANAQKEGKKFSFGFGLEGIKPVGGKDIKEYYNFGGGLSLRFSYKAGPGYATLTGGALGILPKNFDDEDLKAAVLMPIKAGYKYIFLKHLFVQGELGYGRLTIVYEGDDGVEKEPYSGLIYGVTAGGNFGAFEAGIRYEGLGGKNKEYDGKLKLSGIGLRLGFNF
ncbi:MAG: hypothetical protein KF746_07205 [Chitinophagaceae bacterium]|nr:hypothetical protein [Chitinophagaceae bacterium]